jgi:hypothetical protein
MYGKSLSFLITLLCTAATLAADFESGRAAMQVGEPMRALAEWRAAAEQGDPRSLFQLGRMYEEGTVVPADPVTAFVLYRTAAHQGMQKGEKSSTNLANTMAGGDLAKALDLDKRLQAEGRFVPPLPGWPAAAGTVASAAPPAKPAAAATPAPVPAPVPAPKPEAKAAAAPAAAPVPAPAPVAAAAPAAVPPLAVQYNCQMGLRYQDRGSGGKRDIALFQSLPEQGFFSLGGYAQSAYDESYGCVLTVLPMSPDAATRLLVRPAGWQRVWTDKGTGALSNGSIWAAVSPDSQHVCLGHVGQSGYDQPLVEDYRCVHRCLTETRPATNPIWTTGDTGADEKIKIYVLPRINSFIAVPRGSEPAEITDLKLDLKCQ